MVSRTVIAWGSGPWARVNSDRPFLAFAVATAQPGGSARTQGTSDADGTDWASSHSGSGSSQPRLTMLSGAVC